MQTAAIILIVILAILLVLVVLVQNPKGGLGSAFGGSGASQVMGVKKTGDILEKLTWGFAIAIIVLSLAANSFLAPMGMEEGAVQEDANIEAAKNSAPAQNFQQPANPAPGTEAPAPAPAPAE